MMTRTSTETAEDRLFRLLFDYEPEPDSARQHLEVHREQRANDIAFELGRAWGISDSDEEAVAAAHAQLGLELQGHARAGEFISGHRVHVRRLMDLAGEERPLRVMVDEAYRIWVALGCPAGPTAPA